MHTVIYQKKRKENQKQGREKNNLEYKIQSKWAVLYLGYFHFLLYIFFFWILGFSHLLNYFWYRKKGKCFSAFSWVFYIDVWSRQFNWPESLIIWEMSLFAKLNLIEANMRKNIMLCEGKLIMAETWTGFITNYWPQRICGSLPRLIYHDHTVVSWGELLMKWRWCQQREHKYQLFIIRLWWTQLYMNLFKQ